MPPPELTDEELARIVGGGGDDAFRAAEPLEDVGILRGQTVRDIAGGVGRIGITADGRIIFTDPASGRPIQASGWFRLGDGKWFELGSDGQVVDGPRSLTTVEERNVLGGKDPFGAEAIAGAGGGLSFGQRQQLEGEARTFAAEEAEKQRQFGLKRDVADRAGALTRELVGLREQARNIVTETFGQDVLRGSLGAQGALTIGTTPQRAQENVLRGVAAQPIPEALGPEASLSELQQREAELTQRTQGGLPTPGSPLGFAGGTEGTGQGMLVGEAGPEVIEFTPEGTVRVIPITRKAQGGIEEFDPFGGVGRRDPFAQTPAAIGRSLEPVFRELGFGGANVVPLGQTGIFGQSVAGAFGGPEGLQFAPGQAAETFARLGVRPQLLQAEGTNDFYLRTPEGELRPIGGLGEVGAMGLSAEQVTVLPFSEIQEMGRLGEAGPGGPPPATLQPFAQEAAPLRLPLSVDEQGLPDRSGPSIFLPAPRQLAGMWRTLDSDTKALWASAWELAGKSREQAARELGFFTPRGTASQFATAALR
jgi:hypothetical protein